MFKKLALSLMVLLSMTPIAASVLPQASVSADTVKSSQVALQGISASWGGLIPNGPQSFSIGTVDDANMTGIFVQTLVQPVEGFDTAGATFEVFDITTGKVVSEPQNADISAGLVDHKLPVTGVKVGDELALQFWATSGMGAVVFFVSSYN